MSDNRYYVKRLLAHSHLLFASASLNHFNRRLSSPRPDSLVKGRKLPPMTHRQTNQIPIRDLTVSSKALDILQRTYNRN